MPQNAGRGHRSIIIAGYQGLKIILLLANNLLALSSDIPRGPRFSSKPSKVLTPQPFRLPFKTPTSIPGQSVSCIDSSIPGELKFHLNLE
jgi:hypothetical protein